MAVTATIQRADETTAAPLPAAVVYRSAYSHWLTGIDAGGTGQVTERYAGSVERPSAIVIVIDSRAASTVRVQQEPSALLMSQCHGRRGHRQRQFRLRIAPAPRWIELSDRRSEICAALAVDRCAPHSRRF